MKKPATVQALENLGRVRLSKHFFMRDFLYSEISQIEGIPNIPEYPDRAIEAGRGLCGQLLEPLQERFGRIHIRSAYRAPAVNAKGAENNNQYSCAANEKTTRSTYGIIRTLKGIWGLLSASWCRHCCFGMRSARTGRRWPGGFTTACRMPASSGFPNLRHLTFGGAQTRTRYPASAPMLPTPIPVTRQRW